MSMKEPGGGHDGGGAEHAAWVRFSTGVMLHGVENRYHFNTFMLMRKVLNV